MALSSYDEINARSGIGILSTTRIWGPFSPVDLASDPNYYSSILLAYAWGLACHCRLSLLIQFGARWFARLCCQLVYSLPLGARTYSPTSRPLFIPKPQDA